MAHRERNKRRHEYEVQAGDSSGGAHVFVGNSESAAIREAMDLMRNGIWAERGVTHVRLYHTYPSPGPMRRFVGWIHLEDGKLRRAS